MDKYRKVMKPKEDRGVKDENEIRVTAVGSVSAYISRAATVFGELEKKSLVIKATGNALTKAVTSAEVIKRRFKGLHQITTIGQTEITDEYEPLEEGLDMVTEVRQMPYVEITLSTDALDTKDKGYQAPIDESLVTEVDAEEMMKPRGRGRGKGKGKGKGKDKGKGKGKGKGKEDKGKGKGKGKGKDEEKGKGKGKGKGKEEKGKGKGKGKDDGKGKGKGKGKDSGKSKGKGKSYDSWDSGKGKGKGKSKGYSSWDYGYDSWNDDYYGGGKKGSKGGKGKGKNSWW